jgi:uncharacterized protein (DUF952 family)
MLILRGSEHPARIFDRHLSEYARRRRRQHDDAIGEQDGFVHVMGDKQCRHRTARNSTLKTFAGRTIPSGGGAVVPPSVVK